MAKIDTEITSFDVNTLPLSQDVQIIKFSSNGAKCYMRKSILCRRFVLSCQQNKKYSIYEPEGLDYVPDIPEYESVNFKVQGYDFTVLEAYGTYLHRLFITLDYGVHSFPIPAKTVDIQTLKPNSSNVLDRYKLSMYQRVIQVQNLPSTTGSIVLQIAQQNLPEGVTLTVKEADEEQEDERYIPDVVLNNLRDQMDVIVQAKEEKKKK